MLEQPKIIKFESARELQEKKNEKMIDLIKDGITQLQEGKEQYEEWQRIALEQGDQQSALLYEVGALENEMLILKGEILCKESEDRQYEKWHQHFNHVVNVDNKRLVEQRIDDIDSELEFVSDYLESLLEEVNADEQKKIKMEELLKKKDKLEAEKVSYGK
jgi:hypothetical protein